MTQTCGPFSQKIVRVKLIVSYDTTILSFTMTSYLTTGVNGLMPLFSSYTYSYQHYSLHICQLMVQNSSHSFQFSFFLQSTGCKIVYTLFYYILSTNCMWIFVEGIYMHSFVQSTKYNVSIKLYKTLLVFGWGKFSSIQQQVIYHPTIYIVNLFCFT